jgi:hypothetical protein
MLPKRKSTMPKAETPKLRDVARELVDAISDKKLSEAIRDTAADSALLRSAKADPDAFLSKNAIKLPPTTKAKIVKRALPSGTVVGTRKPKHVLELCFTYTAFVIFEDTELEEDVKFTICKTYFVF